MSQVNFAFRGSDKITRIRFDAEDDPDAQLLRKALNFKEDHGSLWGSEKNVFFMAEFGSGSRLYRCNSNNLHLSFVVLSRKASLRAAESQN